MIERCWHGRFTARRCVEPGLYGSPGSRPDGSPAAHGPFLRAARWCLAHRHPGDVLLLPADPDRRRPDGSEERRAH